jgi:NitT/TauT family transport system substrate-binding protein
MRLTPVAKLFITVVILGVLGYTGWHYYQKRGAGTKPAPTAGAANSVDAGASAAPRTTGRIVVGINDFGGAYPAVVANDGLTPGPRSVFKQQGLDVEIRLIKGSKERLKAFDAGEVDVMLLSIDYLAGLMPEYRQKGIELRAFMMADWSRGNCGIVANPKFKTVESLKGARVATTRHTPTHYFLLSMLGRSNLKPAEIEQVKSNLVFATQTPLVGQVYARGEADAVAIWEPYLSQAAAGGKGRVLVTTETATNLIADVLFARLDVIQARERELPGFVRAWLEGVRMTAAEPDRAVEVISKAFKQTPEETRNILGKIKPATFADNRDFFGLEVEDAPQIRLFAEATRFWQKEGWVKTPVSPQESRWLKALEAVAKDHAAEKVVENFKFAPPKAGADPLLTRAVSIYFASGADKLDPNAKKVVDTFAETLGVFQNAFVRVEGNTDSVGGRPANTALSKRRALAVVDYLVTRYRFEPARFLAVGNGPDNPIGDNKTEEGREQNRRTEFKIIANR